MHTKDGHQKPNIPTKTPCTSDRGRKEKLSDKGLGHYKTSGNNKVYCKPLPIDNDKELIGKYGILIKDYKDVFCNKNMKDVTPQFNRLLSMSPNEQTLHVEYGYLDI